MKNRFYHLALFNGAILMIVSFGLIAKASNPEAVGNVILSGVAFLIGAPLLIFASSLKDSPPTLDDIRKMMRGFYTRMLS